MELIIRDLLAQVIPKRWFDKKEKKEKQVRHNPVKKEKWSAPAVAQVDVRQLQLLLQPLPLLRRHVCAGVTQETIEHEYSCRSMEYG